MLFSKFVEQFCPLQADADVEKLLTQDLSFPDYIKEVTKYQTLAEEITYNCRKVRYCNGLITCDCYFSFFHFRFNF